MIIAPVIIGLFGSGLHGLGMAARVALLVGFIAIGVAQPRVVLAETRIALVIGNASYRAVPPLVNPMNDAKAVADALAGVGFEVILRTNVGKTEFERAISEFGGRLSEGATGLFYYAGHGLQLQGHNFLIPVDATITAESKVRLETVDVELALDQMAAAKSRVSIAILDACRNNPFERKHRGGSSGLAQISAPEGTLIAYATGPGRVAADGEGANGLYTSEFIKVVREPGLSIEEVFKRVRVGVKRLSKDEQVPWETSSLLGDFYFAGTAAAVATSRLADPVAASSVAAPGTQGDERGAPIPVKGAPARPVVIISPPRPAAPGKPAQTIAPARPPVVVGSSLDDIPPLVCRAFRRSENILGQTVARQGTECKQPDGSWRVIE